MVDYAEQGQDGQGDFLRHRSAKALGIKLQAYPNSRDGTSANMLRQTEDRPFESELPAMSSSMPKLQERVNEPIP